MSTDETTAAAEAAAESDAAEAAADSTTGVPDITGVPGGSAAAADGPDWLLGTTDEGNPGQQVLDENARQLDTEAHTAIVKGEEAYVQGIYAARMVVKRKGTGFPDYNGDSYILQQWSKDRWENHLPNLSDEECVAVLKTATYAYSPSTGRTVEVAPELMVEVPTESLPKDATGKPDLSQWSDDDWLKIVADCKNPESRYLLLLDRVKLDTVTEAMAAAGVPDEDLNPWADAQEVLRVKHDYWTDTVKRLGDPKPVRVKGRTKTVQTDPGDVLVVDWNGLPEWIRKDRILKMQKSRGDERAAFARKINRLVMIRIRANVSAEQLEAAGVKRPSAVKTLKPGEEKPVGRGSGESTGVDGTHDAIRTAFMSREMTLAERILTLKDLALSLVEGSTDEERKSLGNAAAQVAAVSETVTYLNRLNAWLQS